MEVERGISFESRTMMGRDEAAKIHQVLLSLNSTFDSAPFRDPVNWQQFGLVDYPVIIKNPMDLGTVKKKVQVNRYEYVEDCLDDINLIWANAKLYNPKEHDIHKLADKLEKQTKKMIKNYLPFVKIDTQAKKKPGKKTEEKPVVKPMPKSQQPKTYLQKQEQARIQNQNEQNIEPEEPEHVVKRKNLLYLMQLSNKDQIGVIFQLLVSSNSDAIDFEEDGSVNIHGQKLQDKMVSRLNELMELWGISLKNVVFTTNPTATVGGTKRK